MPNRDTGDKGISASLHALLRYPLIPLFFGFLLLFTAVDMLKPAKALSELENRPLAQAPPFNPTAFFNNEWTYQYGEFTRDQFLGRDGWVSMQSAMEVAQGKLEAGGVWYAKDNYQIAKNDFLSPNQQTLLPINTTAICELAARHPGKVTAMIVPSPANTMADKLRFSPPQIDEDVLLDDIYTDIAAAGAKVVDLRSVYAAEEEAGRPLYYRTDHHWLTTGGARLAYEAFCASAGRDARLPDEKTLQRVDGFLGTNFAKTKRFGTQPEPLHYYDLPNPMSIFRYNEKGEVTREDTGLMDKEKFSGFDKYAAFLHGNNGYSVIEGNGEGSILVIKDSYGNAFVPYLVENYATIGVIDLRGWFDVDPTIAEGGYEDILVLYSFSSFSEDIFANRMATEKQPAA